MSSNATDCFSKFNIQLSISKPLNKNSHTKTIYYAPANFQDQHS